MGMNMNMCCVACTEKSIICNTLSNNKDTKEIEITTNNFSLRVNESDNLRGQSKNERAPFLLNKLLNQNPSTDSLMNKDTDKTAKSLLPMLLSSKIGLGNFGNSCFMNSILQILIHCPPFIKEFEKQKITTKEVVSNAFKDLLIHIVSCNSNKILPKTFFRAFSQENQSFNQQRQQDCQDFLNTFLENINVELNQIKRKISFEELNQIGNKVLLYKDYLSYSNRKEKSIITGVFYWSDLSLRKCTCGRKTHVFSQKTDLPLNLPKANLNPHVTQLIKDKYSIGVSDESPIECKMCNKKGSCELDYSICSLPQVLILSLQRNNGEDSQKNKVAVEFEDEMDLSDIVDKDVFDRKAETKFALYGLVVHIGKIERGHYITNIRLKDQWIMFDDDKVEVIPADTKNSTYKSSDVYCLFYLRKDSQ